MASDPNEGSRIIKFGKFTGVIYPEIYYQTVLKLHKEHPDLISLMQIAQVSFEDFTAQEYLAIVLNVEINRQMPMEEGYQIIFDALQKRTGNRELDKLAQETAVGILNDKLNVGKFRPEELAGTSLFPDADALIDKNKFDKRVNWKDEK